MLIGIVVSSVIAGAVSLAVVKMNQNFYGSLSSASISIQAQSYAQSEGERLRHCPYNQLAGMVREGIDGSDNYEREVLLSAETSSGSISERTATVNIYRVGESLPRSSLQVIRSTAEVQSSGVPIGTIIAWPGSNPPTEGGTWLLCNGQSAAVYPQLKAIVGSTVPNLNGRFLEGTIGTPRSFKEAGLPNITGQFDGNVNDGLSKTGSFYVLSSNISGSDGGKGGGYIGFNASRCSAIYGKSSTVQPASYTVRYYIKAT